MAKELYSGSAVGRSSGTNQVGIDHVGGIVLETPPPDSPRVHPEDAAALALVISDPETMRSYPAPFDSAPGEEWIARNVHPPEAAPVP